MELLDALRTTGAVRDFTDEPVSDATLERILDAARFSPSGGNRQGWRVVVVKEPSIRRALRDLYLPVWYEYLAQVDAGLVAWAPVTDRVAEAEARSRAPEFATAAQEGAGGLAEHLDEAPVLAVVLADLRALAATDRDLDHYTLVGGASVYPFVWSMLLAAREEGLGGVLTTMLAAQDGPVRALLGAPDHFAVVAAVVLGHPVRRPRHLRRAAVSSFCTVDRLDGEAFLG